MNAYLCNARLKFWIALALTVFYVAMSRRAAALSALARAGGAP